MVAKQYFSSYCVDSISTRDPARIMNCAYIRILWSSYSSTQCVGWP